MKLLLLLLLLLLLYIQAHNQNLPLRSDPEAVTAVLLVTGLVILPPCLCLMLFGMATVSGLGLAIAQHFRRKPDHINVYDFLMPGDIIPRPI